MLNCLMRCICCLLAMILIFAVNILKAGISDTTHVENWDINSLVNIGGHTVTVYGNPHVVDTDKGKAVQFDGNGDMLLVDANPIGDATEFTIEVVFKPDAGVNITTEPRFIHIQDPADAAAKRITIELRVNSQNEWYFDGFLKTDVSSLTLIDAAKTHATNEWMHAAVTYKDKVFSTYVNGVKELSGDVNYSQKVLSNVGKTSIGARMNEKNWYSGLIKTLKVTHKALSPDEFVTRAGEDTTVSVKDTSSSVTLVKSISENQRDIYPVLANKELYIRNTNSKPEMPTMISFYSMSGALKYRLHLFAESDGNITTVNLHDFHEGLYLVRVQFRDTCLIRKICVVH